MTRRARIRLLIILVVVGLPLAAVMIISWYIGSGRLERRIERAYAKKYPGSLQIGDVRVASASQLVLSDVRLCAPESDTAVITIPKLTVGGSLLSGHVGSVSCESADIVIDRAAVELFRAIRAQDTDDGATFALPDFEAHVGASVAISGGIRADNLRLDLVASGGNLSGRLSGLIDQAPLQIAVSTATDGGLHYVVVLQEARLSLQRLFACLTELRVMDPIPKILPWLPDVVDARDATFSIDPAARVATGAAGFTWATGSANTRLLVDAERLLVDPAEANDSGLGNATGELALDFRRKSLSVAVSSWRPGPRLPIPRKLDLTSFLRLLPAARFELTNNSGRPRFHLTAVPDLSGRQYEATLDLIGEKHGPLHVRANDVPLSMAQPWLPDDLTVEAGRIVGMLIEADDGKLLSAALTAAEAEVSCSGWNIGPVDAGIEVKPLSDANGFATTIILPMGTVEYSGDDHGGLVTADIDSLKKLLSAVHGGDNLPALTGKVHILSTLSRSEGVRGQIKELQTTNLKLADIFRALDSASSGSFAYDPAAKGLEIHLSGQLNRGEAWIPGGWLDIALRKPVFTATVAVNPGQIELREVMARATDDQGQPSAEGFTAGINGVLSTEPLAGKINGVIDRADLEWVKANTKLVPLPKSSAIKGRGAATFTAHIAAGSVEQVDGYFLPLNDDLTMLKDDKGALLDISGIKGAMKFHLAKPKQATP
jgi:hypothetical protein